MKRISLLSLAMLVSLVGQTMYPYAMVNDASSAAPVTVYVFKDQDKYLKLLKAKGIPDDVLKYAGMVAKAAPAIGAALAAPTSGVSLVVSEALPISVEASKKIVEGLRAVGIEAAALRKAAGVIALHTNVNPGNKGRGAEWNWADIQKEYGIQRGAPLYVVVTDKNYGVPLLQTTIASDGLLGFAVKKNAAGNLYAEESASAVSQYVPSSQPQQNKNFLDTVKGTIGDLWRGR